MKVYGSGDQLSYLSTLYVGTSVLYGGQVGNRYVRQGEQTENQGGQTNFIEQMFAHPGLKLCRRPWH